MPSKTQIPSGSALCWPQFSFILSLVALGVIVWLPIAGAICFLVSVQSTERKRCPIPPSNTVRKNFPRSFQKISLLVLFPAIGSHAHFWTSHGDWDYPSTHQSCPFNWESEACVAPGLSGEKHWPSIKKERASLVAQWLRIHLPMQGTRVRALVWEDPTCRGATRPVSHNYWACASGACAPQQERPR